MLKVFITGFRDFIGRGAGSLLAKSIHMQESAFSRFITDPERQFDAKTFYAMGLLSQLKQEIVEDADLVKEGYLGPFTFREWKKGDEIIYTWFPTREKS